MGMCEDCEQPIELCHCMDSYDFGPYFDRYAQYYQHLDDLKANPQDWFIYSGAAYECIQTIAKIAPMAGFELEHQLKNKLAEIGVQLGATGKDKFNRVITQDWYGTYYTPSQESLEFIQRKHAQLKRIDHLLRQKSLKARALYDKADHICETSSKPIISRANRDRAFRRLGTLDKWSAVAFNCYTRYRRDFGAEFSQLEK